MHFLTLAICCVQCTEYRSAADVELQRPLFQHVIKACLEFLDTNPFKCGVIKMTEGGYKIGKMKVVEDFNIVHKQ